MYRGIVLAIVALPLSFCQVNAQSEAPKGWHLLDIQKILFTVSASTKPTLF